MKAKFLTATALAMLATGCSSITGTTGQSVSLQTRDKAGAEVPGASCELSNNKGKWFVTTPGSVQVRRSNDDMIVQCNKQGFESGQGSVVSETKGSMFGNIIFGGGIGAVIDHNSGAAYEYPTLIQIVMGTFSKVEATKPAPGQSGNIPANPSVSASPEAATAPMAAAAPTTLAAAAPAAAQTAATTSSTETRLQELKRLREADLITQDVYIERQRSVLEGK